MGEVFLIICGIKLSNGLIYCWYKLRIVFFLITQQCDVLAQDVVPTPQRNKIVDLTTYWHYGDYVFLIPVPVETANINSLVKPFQWPVCTFYFVLKSFVFKDFLLSINRFG
jgi:hypothetical protein